MFKVDYVSVLFSSPMISVLHNIMWSVGKNVTHKAKGKNSTKYECVKTVYSDFAIQCTLHDSTK